MISVIWGREGISWTCGKGKMRDWRVRRGWEIGQSHRLSPNNPGTRRRVMRAGVVAPSVGRSCVNDMCHCSNSAAQHLLSAPTIHSGIPLFKVTTMRDICSSFIRWLEYFPVLEIVPTAKWLHPASSCKSVESRNLIGRSFRAIKSIVVVPNCLNPYLWQVIYPRTWVNCYIQFIFRSIKSIIC